MPQRIRSKGFMELSSLKMIYGHPSNPPPGYTTYERGIRQKGTNAQIVDTLTPRYREVRRAGLIAMNACVIQSNSYECTVPGSISITHPTWGWETLDGDMCQYIAAVQDGVSFSEDEKKIMQGQALLKAYARMNASPVLGGEILSDLSKTASMLRRPFKQAAELVWKTTARRDKLLKRFARNTAKANANAWLEYRYGWKPIIMDALTIMRDSQKVLANMRVGFQIARGTVKREKKFSYPFTGTGIGGASFNATGTGNNVSKFTSNAGVLYRMLPLELPAAVLQALGLDARSIPATLWEIVPFSFVADWFINVGTFIEAITPRLDVQVLNNWETSTYEISKVLSGSVSRTIYDLPQTTYTGNLGSSKTVERFMERRVDLTLPFTPSLKGTLPSGKQFADALALSTGGIIKGLYSLRH